MESNEEKSIRGMFKTKAVGDSLYLLIDKKTKDYLGIGADEYLLARLSTIQERTIQCPKCKHEMVVLSNDDVFDCALCGEEFTMGQIETEFKQPEDDKDLVEGSEDKSGSLKGGNTKNE